MKHTSTLFFCSVFFSSWIGGVWPGMFACLISAIALDYYFIPPLYALGIGPEEAPDMISFVVSALIISWLSGERKRTNETLRKEREELHAGVRERSSKLGPAKDQSHTVGELAAPIAHELSARIGKVEELVHEFKGCTPAPEKTEPLSFNAAREFLADPTFCLREESVFFREGDYWTIHYQGQIAHLKATRGLHCLASLLRYPDREFHVTELIAVVRDEGVAPGAHLVSSIPKGDGSQLRTARFQDADPILDARARAEYAHRVTDLQGELEDAERLNDPERARKARQERDCIADQLAMAVGLGGRNRKAGSQAERARSAVTKRIKDSINKITEAIPLLGRPLGYRNKDGLFLFLLPEFGSSH